MSVWRGRTGLSVSVAMAVLAGVVLTAACSEDEGDPLATQVMPLLESRCAAAACHGSPVADKANQLDPLRWLTFPIDANGKIADQAKALISVKAKINSTENPAFSTLLRKALPVAQGGQYHYQNAVFTSRDDPAYKTLASWVATVKDGGEAKDHAPLNPREKLFYDKVYPTLIDRGCATSTCHGSLMFGGAVFTAPAIPGTHQLPKADIRNSYIEAKRNISLWGDPLRSRLIAKILPLEQGGIPHKGGNDVFLASEAQAGDPRNAKVIKDMLEWIAAERQDALGANASLAGKADPPVVAVGGPLQVAKPFDQPSFTPGSDLYLLTPPYTGTPVNLTQAAHSAPADIRDPAPSHDGKTIAFTMRKSADDGVNLYTIGVDGSGLKQLTQFKATAAAGTLIGAYQPTYGPNGGFVDPKGNSPAERIYFSGVKALDRSDNLDTLNADLYAMDPDGANLEQLTWTVVPENNPWFLATGEFAGTMAYTIRRSAEGGFKGVIFRFPIDHNSDHHIQPEAHPHFGMSEPQQLFWRLREFPEGRATLTVQDEGNMWRGGQLAMLERQFAVEVPEGQEAKATVPAFRHALTILTPKASRQGASEDGLWRDPTPMPDGSLLVAHAAGPMDLNDAAAQPKLALKRLTLKEDRPSSRPVIDQVTLLQDGAAMSWSHPVAVVVRGTEDPPHERKWNQQAALATLVHSGVQVIEAVLAHLPPLTARPLRQDIAVVRAVVPLSVAGAVDASPIPAAETRHAWKNATQASATGRMPLFAAAEVPPAVDGSLAAEIPAKVAVRIVTLDKDGLAVGALQNQWYAAAPGERFPVGIPASSYNARCGGCHGALDGNPNSVLQPAMDFVTQASVTAALYVNADRRKPATLPVVGPSMFILVDFVKDVMPILSGKCATGGCHSGTTPAGGLSLLADKTAHYNDAYESLLAPGNKSAGGFQYVDALGYRARASYLAEKLMGKEYDAAGTVSQPCPPPSAPQLTDAERRTLLRWIEFGAAWQGVPKS